MKKFTHYPILFLLLSNTFFALAQNRFCQFNQIFQGNHSNKELQKAEDNDSMLYIPVVVHIVYNQAEENIPDSIIQTQMASLNQDFQFQHIDTATVLESFKMLTANCKLHFYLATLDENSFPTSGITRTSTSHGPFGNDDIHFTALGGKDAWNTQKYLNVWICNLAPGIGGYGTPPGTSSEKDGVVIHYEYVGNSSYPTRNKGRTLVHEIGHYLGLDHPWATGGCVDDGIADTPVQEGPSSGCELNKTSCNSLNMIQNFMDYSDDDCRLFFTKGQKAVMRNTILTSRKGLLENVVNVIEEKEAFPFAIYPNPSLDGIFHLEFPFSPKIKKLEIINSLGKVVQSYSWVHFLFTLNLQKFPKGFYYLKVDTNQNVYFQPIVYF